MTTATHRFRLAPMFQLSQRALLIWGGIVAIALLSFYVHVLHEAVLRSGEVRAQANAPRAAPAGWHNGAPDGRAYAAQAGNVQGQAMPAALRQFAIEGLQNVRP